MSNAPNSADLSAAAVAGQAVYSKRVLRLYDWLVLGLSNRLIWRCPTKHLEQMYDSHVSDNHLDVGVGTGYFLDRCRFPTDTPRVALMDLNENCLRVAGARISRYQPQQLVRNLLAPIDYDGDPFDSIGLNYVLHCLPGSLQEKAVVFDHLSPLLAADGILFGSTILAAGVPRNLAAQKLMGLYNRKQIFSNTLDSLEDLQSVLMDRCDEWHVETVGCVALFWCQRPRKSVIGLPE